MQIHTKIFCGGEDKGNSQRPEKRSGIFWGLSSWFSEIYLLHLIASSKIVAGAWWQQNFWTGKPDCQSCTELPRLPLMNGASPPMLHPCSIAGSTHFLICL
jgi:hypothetical protein